MKTVLIIPSYNPDLNILNTIVKLRRKNIKNKIIIIDDGSSAKSRLIFCYIKKNFKNIKIFRNLKNLGQGGAIKEGLKKSKISYLNKICTIDDDGQHHADDVKKVLHLIENSITQSNVYFGVRLFTLKETPFFSLIGNFISKKIFNLITKFELKDTQTGLRAYSYFAINKIKKIKNNGFDYHNIMNFFLFFEKIKIKQIKIKTIYFDKNKKTKFKSIKDSLKILKEIFIKKNYLPTKNSPPLL